MGAAATPDHEVLVLGAGMGGLTAGVSLKRAGIHDFAILEREEEVGGTWRVNSYPGLAVDVPAFAYQLSYDLNPNWSRVFAPGHEIREYTEGLVDRHGLRPHMRLATEVKSAEFDEGHDLWRIRAGRRVLRARHVISALGGLRTPKLPDIAGLESFEGKTMHTARWDHSHDLTGERVAVIGTGATAVQLVPTIAPQLEQLHVYQRTPIWVLPKLDADLTLVRPFLRTVPLLQRALRLGVFSGVELVMVLGASYNRQLPWLTRAVEELGKGWLRAQVRDPATREALTPHYGFGCKRPSVSNDYLRTFNRRNTELVTSPIAEITPTGIRTADGEHREIDTLVLATGYYTTEPEELPPVPVRGVGGRDLREYWSEERIQAYEGVSMVGFPNLFLAFGPYAAGGLSILSALENGATHATRVIAEARRRGATRAEIRREHHDAFFEEMLRRRRNSMLFQGRCDGSNSYYYDSRGDTPLFRPGGSLDPWWRSRHFDLEHYAYTARAIEPPRDRLASRAAGGSRASVG